MRRSILMAAAALVLAGAAAAKSDGPAEELARALKDHVPGKTSQCIDPQLASGPQVIGHDTLLYRQGGVIWKTNVVGPCPALDENVTIIADIYGGQLCKDDRFRVKEPNAIIPSAYCRLGSFQQYVPVRK